MNTMRGDAWSAKSIREVCDQWLGGSESEGNKQPKAILRMGRGSLARSLSGWMPCANVQPCDACDSATVHVEESQPEEGDVGKTHPTAKMLTRASSGTAIIINHITTDLTRSSLAWIQAARERSVWL